MHRLTPGFVLGYHGCSRATAERLLSGEPFRLSTNRYDWLGKGAYFWESDPSRGLSYFREAQLRSKSSTSDITVVGAVIDLGFCLDLSTSLGVAAVGQAYESLRAIAEVAQAELPQNAGGDADLVLCRLDCAVINHLHDSRERDGLVPYQTVRAMFQEGTPAFPGSKFRAKTHIQIAVLDLRQIHGVFRVPEHDMNPDIG